MDKRAPVILDMTPDGEIRSSNVRGLRLSWPMRIGLAATLVAVAAGGIVLAALFLWLASVLLPVVLVAGLVAYGMFRLQRRQVTR